MKAHRRAKNWNPSSKQAQVHARRPTWSIKMKSPSKVAPHMKSCKGSEPITSKWCSAVSTQVAVVHDRPATSQSCYPYLPTNRPITLSLPFNQPLRFRFCSSIESWSLTLMPAAQLGFRWWKSLSRLFIFLLFVFFFKSTIAARPQRAAPFFPRKIPIPPSAPSKQHNSVPGLPFIPATVWFEAPCSIRRESPPSLV